MFVNFLTNLFQVTNLSFSSNIDILFYFSLFSITEITFYWF